MGGSEASSEVSSGTSTSESDTGVSFEPMVTQTHKLTICSTKTVETQPFCERLVEKG